MIFLLCRDTGVPIWNTDVIRTSTGLIDISLIIDEANEGAPPHGPISEIQPLGENFADTFEETRGSNHAT